MNANIYHLITLLIVLSAFFAYVNFRYIKLPFVIGLFFLSTILSIVVLSGKLWMPQSFSEIKLMIDSIPISDYILNVMLGFLLFAGALHTNWACIKKQIKQISAFAIGGVLVSTIIIASAFYGICLAFNLQVEFIYCLLFGALISPTDPVAVLGILTKANVPKKIETIIVGESLFNDGVGVVVFVALLKTLQSNSDVINYADFGKIFLQEAVGGVAFGLMFGFILHKLLKSINHYETEVLLTLAFVMAGYSLASYMHLSGPLAIVVMGLLVGNYKNNLAMSDITEEYVNKFWELIDVILNAVLFILIAFVLLVIEFNATYIVIGIATIFIVIFARFISVYFPAIIFPKSLDLNRNESRLIVWGGLRGGLSIALVLSLPDSETKNLLLIATYFCVLFSILVQGLTIEKLATRWK